MTKTDLLHFVMSYRGSRTKKLQNSTVDVLGLGPVDIGFDPVHRRHYFHLKNENGRPVTLADVKE